MKLNTVQQVVLVDDDPDYIYLVEQALTGCTPACNLTVLPSGAQLLAWLDESASRPNLIFLDINMPGANGFEVLKELKSTDRFKMIPVVMLTVSERRADVSKSYAIGANAYLVKPMTFGKLKSRLAFFNYYWFDVSRTPSQQWGETNWYNELTD